MTWLTSVTGECLCSGPVIWCHLCVCMYVYGSVCAVMCHCKIQLTLFSVSAAVCVCDSLLGVHGSVTCLACCRISHVVFVFTLSL